MTTKDGSGNTATPDFVMGFAEEQNLIAGLLVRPELIPQISNMGLTKEHLQGKSTSVAWDSIAQRAASGRAVEAPWLMHELERRKVSKSARSDLIQALGSQPSADPMYLKQLARRAMLTKHFMEREKILREAQSNLTLAPKDFMGIVEELQRLEEQNSVEPTFFARRRNVLPDMVPANEFTPAQEDDPIIAKGLLLRQGITLLTGPSKAGKSFCALEIARSVVQGDSFLGMADVIKKGLKIAYIQGEISDSQVHKRLQQLGIKHPNLLIQPVPKDSFFLNRVKKSGYGEQAAGNVQTLLKFSENVKARGLDVLIFDPLYKFLDGSELDEVAVKSAFDTLDQLAEWTNTAIALVHHNKKRQPGQLIGGELSSGHSIMHRAPVSIITLFNQQDDARQEKRIQMAFELRCHEPIRDMELIHKNGKLWATLWNTSAGLNVFDWVKDQGKPVTCKDVEKALDLPNSTAWNALKKLVKNGDLQYAKPHYWFDPAPRG